MEPGQPREVREPGPGAETAVAPRWEEAKTFYDNLSPKKKPKSVKSGAWVWGGGGTTLDGQLPGRGLKPSGNGLVEPLPEGTQLLRPRMCPAVGSGSRLFWELCSGGGGLFSPPRAQVPRQNPPPPCCHQGPIPSPTLAAPEALADRTC